jgi:hypothetical protein
VSFFKVVSIEHNFLWTALSKTPAPIKFHQNISDSGRHAQLLCCGGIFDYLEAAVYWTGVLTGMLETVFVDFLIQETVFQNLFFYSN